MFFVVHLSCCLVVKNRNYTQKDLNDSAKPCRRGHAAAEGLVCEDILLSVF